MSPTSIDPNSGFCYQTKTFHSLRPEVHLPPPSLPLSSSAFAFAFAFSSSSPLPSHPAFVDSVTAAFLSYPQLLSRVHSLSSSLQTHYSLPPNATAFVISPPTLHIPILYFSLLHLGIAVSPSNPSSSPSEISRHLQLSNPSLIFATSSATAKLTTTDADIILLDSPHFLSLLLDSPTGPLSLPRVDQSDTAAVMFSSGTTGMVKGVALTHRNLIASMAPFSTAAGAAATVSMVTVPLFHVFGFSRVFSTVAAGGTMVIMTERFDVRRVMGAVGRFGVRSLLLAPPALLAVVRFAENGGGDGDGVDLSSLQGVHSGGAPIGAELLCRFAERFPNVVPSQGYGLTESTSGFFRSIGREQSQRRGTVGRLDYGYEAKIVDPVTGIALDPCNQGELWVRGPTVMKGYIGDTKATFATLTSEGWLKTGDLGYIDGDGFLFIVDRLKDLIKYKGYQVPPAELEHLIQTHEDVIEAAVIPYPDEEAGQIPMAFVVRKPDSILSAAEIMEFVAKQVAPYKRIRRVSFINSIPKNAGGKLLRKDLINRSLRASSTNPKL